MNKVRAYRRFMGLSQVQLAEKLGISTNSYANKETKKNEFTLSEIKKYMEELNKVDESINAEDVFFAD